MSSGSWMIGTPSQVTSYESLRCQPALPHRIGQLTEMDQPSPTGLILDETDEIADAHRSPRANVERTHAFPECESRDRRGNIIHVQIIPDLKPRCECDGPAREKRGHHRRD